MVFVFSSVCVWFVAIVVYTAIATRKFGSVRGLFVSRWHDRQPRGSPATRLNRAVLCFFPVRHHIHEKLLALAGHFDGVCPSRCGDVDPARFAHPL